MARIIQTKKKKKILTFCVWAKKDYSLSLKKNAPLLGKNEKRKKWKDRKTFIRNYC